ncbi:MAG: immune inhibitor A [Chloroflexi bacterium]|nr:immune inhibitor A [Chloroflexota bacterium]
MRFAAIALVLAAVAALATLTYADDRSAPQLMADRLLAAPLPARNPLDLAVRLRGLSAATPLIAPIAPAPLVAGYTENFWILDQRTAQLFQTNATLQLVTDHAYWFVETDMTDRAPAADLAQSAATFENRIYPLIHRYFGSEPKPAVDRDGHIVFLLANVPGVAAYFSSADAYPRAINPRSNQHEMIYVNLNALRPGQTAFDSTITHELQHMANFAHCPSQEGWVDEGASELAMRVAGYDTVAPAAFAARPSVQLTAWTNQPADLTRHYQASYLFLRYVAERAGGWEALPDLLAPCLRGESLFASFLTRDPIEPDLDSLFSDWTVANLLQDASVGDGRYAYAGGGFHTAITGRASPQTPFLGSVPQYAADYVDLPTASGTVTFSGDGSVSLLPIQVESSGVWWSNRGDSLDSRLTRRIDLTGVDQATLQFSAWYDVEDRFDFVYLSASPDNGRTWQVLHGQHTVPDRNAGNNYGEGWTGASGPDWIDEQVDLTPYVGKDVILRFEYVTDQSYNGPGFAFKDLRVPEIGLDEPGAVEDAWNAEGWMRVDAPIPEHWNLRLVRSTPDGTSVDTVPVDPDGNASITLDGSERRSVLVVAPTAPRTLVPANYSVTVAAPDKPLSSST